MTDCHTHILPHMDDGSRSSDESIDMLRMEKEQGVDRVILTPHFYAEHESINEFISRRDSCLERLCMRVQQLCLRDGELPALGTGAEVRYFAGMSRADDIRKLCISGTDYMLVEMPFDTWTPGVFRNLEILQSSGIHPVIAHIERFIRYQKHTDNLERLWDMGLLIQSNTSYFNDRRTRRAALRLLKQGRIDLVATDCHRADGERTPDMAAAMDIIEKKLGSGAAGSLKENSRRLSAEK